MTNLIITGANGKMGKVIQSIVANRNDCNIVAGVDLNTEDNGHFPIYSSIFDVKEKADAIIDFSNPVLLNDLLSYSEKTSTPLVIATTGYSDEQKKQISDASKKIPVVFTYNMSMGVNLLANLAKKAVEVLGNDFDIEIVEKHHNQKIDAPSGTALMLADAMCEEIDRTPYGYSTPEAVRSFAEGTPAVCRTVHIFQTTAPRLLFLPSVPNKKHITVRCMVGVVSSASSISSRSEM